MVDIISHRQVEAYERLEERLFDLRAVVDGARSEAPDLQASQTLVLACADLLADIYRLISRQPFARTLPRPDPLAPPSHRLLSSMLRDARLALKLFRHAHSDHHPDGDGEWLTLDEPPDL